MSSHYDGGISAEKLQHAVLTTNLQLCPTMDLLSFQLNRTTVMIYRRNNELVWDVEMAKSTDPVLQELLHISSDKAMITSNTATAQSVHGLLWRPDGKAFALIGSKGFIDLKNTMSGDTILKFDLNCDVACFSWGKQNGSDQQVEDKKTNDVFEILPSLNENYGNILTEDSLIKCENSAIDYITIGLASGSVTLVFSSIFIIEDIQLTCLISKGSFCIKNVVTDKDILSQYIMCLMESSSPKLVIARMDIPLLAENSLNINEIAMISSKILGAVASLGTTLKAINDVYVPYIDYTTRIVELLREEIQQNLEHSKIRVFGESESNINPVDDLYDLLLTGTLSDATKKWMTDYLGDRGLKRWQKLGSTYFDKAREFVFSEFISVLTHLICYLTKASNMQPANEDIRLSLAAAQEFLKESYSFIIGINEFQKQFGHMIDWMTMILKEIIGDDHTAIDVNVKDIVKFLLFVSTLTQDEKTKGRLEAVSDTADKNVDRLQQLLETLKQETGELFRRTKAELRSNIRSDTLISIGELQTTDDQVDIQMDSSRRSIGYVSILKDHLIEIVQFNGITGETHKTSIWITDENLANVTSCKILNSNTLIIMVLHSHMNSELIFVDIDCSVPQQLLEDDLIRRRVKLNISAANIVVNTTKNLVCVLDTDCKTYIWIDLSQLQLI